MRIVGIILFGLFSLNAYSAFNNKYFKGSYAFRLVGPSTLVQANGSNTVATGVIIADGKGAVKGHGSFRTAGITCLATITGSYRVDNDGTGFLASILATSTPGCFRSVLDVAIVLAESGNKFEMSNNENDYMSGTLTRQTLK